MRVEARLFRAGGLIVILLLVVLAPSVRESFAINALNLALVRSAGRVGGDWLSPDAAETTLWSDLRHPATIDVGRPGAADPMLLENAAGEAAAEWISTRDVRMRLSLLRLLHGNWQQSAAAFNAAKTDPLNPANAATAYGYQVISGLAALQRGDADSAVDALRLAAWLGGDRSAPDGTFRLLYRALALAYEQQAGGHPSAWRPAYLHARYLDLADDPAGLTALQRILQTNWPDAPDSERADAMRRGARHLDSATAIAQLNTAAASPNADALVLSDLALRLRQAGDVPMATAVENQLNVRQPQFHVGEWVGQEWSQRPAAIDNTWRLVGYDLDSQALDDGGEITTVLYWCTASGARVVEVRLVHNLAPNGGFEWSPPTGATPVVGYAAGVYGEDAQSSAIRLDQREDEQRRVLTLLGDPTSSGSGVLSQASIPVRSNQLYLEAGWRRDGGSGLLGRSCGTRSGAGAVDYVAYPDQANAWRYYANVAMPLPSQTVDSCRVFLANASQRGSVLFDQILFIPVDPPQQS